MKKFYNADANDAAGSNKQDEPELSGSQVSENGSIKKDEDQENLNSAGIDEEVVRMRYGLEAQEKIKEFRRRCDSLYLTAKCIPGSRYTSLAVTAFESSRQFCGVILKERGSSAPGYYKPGDEAVSVIDRGQVIESVIDIVGHVSQLKALREAAEEVIVDFGIYIENTNHGSVKEFVAQNTVMQQLIAGKMWLGERIGEIAEEQRDNTKGE